MCGLLGFSGNKNQKFDKNKIKTLFLYNQDRGKDASGFWSPKNNLIKSLDQATKFLTKDFKKIQEDCLLIGHVRQGTIGKNMLSVAHPFVGDNAVLAHNGTLNNYIKLASKYEISHADYTTDTQVLHKILDSNFGTKILTEIDGSASLLIADKNVTLKKGQENSLLMTFRLNNQRPLFYGLCDEGMYISSIEESLEAIDCVNIKEFDTNTLYTIFEGNIIKELKIPCRPVREFTSSYNNSYGGYYNNNSNSGPLTGADINYWLKYVNNWIKTDRTDHHNQVEKDTYYLLKEVDLTNKNLTIEDDKGVKKVVQPFSFYYNQPSAPLNILTTDTFVVIMKKLTDTSTKEVVFNRGDVVKTKPVVTVNQKGVKIINCLSSINGEWFDVDSSFVRPCESTEITKYNVYDDDINNYMSDKKNNATNNKKSSIVIKAENESFIAQYMVESGLLTSDELSTFVEACDNKEMSSLFDIAEDMIISLNDFEDAIKEETDSISLTNVRLFQNTIEELKEKTSSLLINMVNAWKTTNIV